MSWTGKPMELGELLRRVFATDGTERRWLRREDYLRARSELLAMVREQPQGREARYAFPKGPPPRHAGASLDDPFHVVTLAEAIKRVEWFLGDATD